MVKKLKLKDSKFSLSNKVGLLKFARDDIRNDLTGSNLIEDLINTIKYINET